MRLVVLGPGHPFRGGIARTTTELVRALAGRGHQVEYLTPRSQYPRRLYPGGGDRDPDASPRIAGSLALLDPLRPWRWKAARQAAVHAGAAAWLIPYWTWAWAPCWRHLLGAPAAPPVVAIAHNPADHGAGRLRRRAADLVLRRAAALFTHARVLADELERRYPGIPVASHPIPPPALPELPARSDARRRLGLAVDGRLALFLGLIRPYKGVDLLVEAWRRLPPASPWRLVVAGEPWQGLGARLERQVRAAGVSDRVRLELRWVPEPEVASWLAAADLVVLPYRSGSQSAVAPLALGAGRPVLASRVGGLPEIVEHGVNGVLVAPGSAGELAAALGALDEDRLASLAAGARRWSERVTWEGYAAAVERLVAEVVGTREGRSESSVISDQ